MAAISTPKISSVYSRIVADFAEIRFVEGEDFQWSAEAGTIAHPAIANLEDIAFLLHEIGHAALGHRGYERDVQLVQMEREAWEFAVGKLAARYGVGLSLEDDIVQLSLDTYRDWLHRRSSCPQCGAVGIESAKQTYTCLVCERSWRVNEARACQLKRYAA